MSQKNKQKNNRSDVPQPSKTTIPTNKLKYVANSMQVQPWWLVASKAGSLLSHEIRTP